MDFYSLNQNKKSDSYLNQKQLKNLSLKLNLMKKILLAVFVITGFAACKSNSDSTGQNRNIQLLSDSSTYNNNVFSDTTATVKAEAAAEISAKPHTIIRTKSTVKSRIKMQTATSVANPTVPVSPVAAQTVPSVSTSPIATTPSTESTTVDKSSGVGNSSETASTRTQTKVQKKGMTKATQGAIIGGVTGAVGGAIVSKKKGVGAVIGGIAGAAGGYIIGNKMDKKDNKFMIE